MKRDASAAARQLRRINLSDINFADFDGAHYLAASLRHYYQG
jgi:hypothetical protein